MSIPGWQALRNDSIIVVGLVRNPVGFLTLVNWPGPVNLAQTVAADALKTLVDL